ncbi:6-phosphogluconolactonase [Aureimonas fodinaquatilis]|uniref:6-phosphogluconolactonase n=1 Tax=Aureimonas fodinaquatilis TaxID=2565783 RepID=A0A5B0DUS8_9HYPH|nr:6-phosphogluconolactonase [Aureimonas fodinaquatilis]KAA0968959.1 6-phosphogluconolactonase [Aureimonas fodinaquatilis]
MDLRFHEYPDRAALAEALAMGVASVLTDAIQARGSATLAVSGGSTPKLFFEKLSHAQIEWNRVSVLLVDERWVEADSPRSNARLLREHLLQNAAKDAHFEPLFLPELTAPEAVEVLSQRLAPLVKPLDVAVLGMGNDGHTASFFPQADNLAAALAPNERGILAAIEAPGAGEPRMTLTLPVLLSAHLLALHIEGDDKRETLRAALAGGPVEAMPVRAVLNQSERPDLQIFWAR